MKKRLRGKRLKARARASWKRPRKDALRECYGEERDGGEGSRGREEGGKAGREAARGLKYLKGGGVIEADCVNGRGRGRQGHGSRAQPGMGRGDRSSF